jgi:hypothetical protein
MSARSLTLLLAVATACGARSSLDPAEGAPAAIDGSDGEPNQSANPHQDPSTAGNAQPTAGSGPQQSPGSNQGPGSNQNPSSDPGPTPDPDPNPNPNPDPTPKPDVNCTSDRAKGGMACTAACVTSCGYYGMGIKTCDCVSGVFVSCHCPRPLYYQGATTAPACATPDGQTHWLDNTACTTEWAECIGNDPVSGSNPRGCLCLTDPVNGKLEWTCGSTNKWFLPQ